MILYCLDQPTKNRPNVFVFGAARRLVLHLLPTSSSSGAETSIFRSGCRLQMSLGLGVGLDVGGKVLGVVALGDS